MSTEILILIFVIVFSITNVFYIELIERMFNTKQNRLVTTISIILVATLGALMLELFGSMSALGYTIMLTLYSIMVMILYPKQSIPTKVAGLLSFNIHIMVIRALVVAIAAYIFNINIYDLMQDPNTFWLTLIYTSLVCCIITIAMLRFIPARFLNVVNQKTEYLNLYIAILLLANIYMILNGNVYIYDLDFEGLLFHQILASLTWLFATYICMFMLVGLDILKEYREAAADDIIYRQVVAGHAISIMEMNCSKDQIIRLSIKDKEQQISGSSYSQYAEQALKDLIYPDDYDLIFKQRAIPNIISRYQEGIKEDSLNVRIILEDNSLKWVRSFVSAGPDTQSGDILALIALMDDIHDTKIKELDLEHQAQIDPLLGAYNKKATEQYIYDHLNKNKAGSLLMIDLDNFKAINDNFGHLYGDDVLKEAYLKIVNNFRSDDIIGRVGGDEFVVFIVNLLSREELARKAEDLCQQLQQTYQQEGIKVTISCSIGIANAPEHGLVFEELYQKADLAMYICKKDLKNGYQIYHSGLEKQ